MVVLYPVLFHVGWPGMLLHGSRNVTQQGISRELTADHQSKLRLAWALSIFLYTLYLSVPGVLYLAYFYITTLLLERVSASV